MADLVPDYILLHAPDGRPVVVPTGRMIAVPVGHADGMPGIIEARGRRYARQPDGSWKSQAVRKPGSGQAAGAGMTTFDDMAAGVRERTAAATPLVATDAEMADVIASWEQAGGTRSTIGSKLTWLDSAASLQVMETPDVVYSRLTGAGGEDAE